MANMHIVAGTVRTWPVGKLQISIEHEGQSGSFDRVSNSSPYVLKLFDKELSSDCFNRGFLPACLVES